MANIQRVKNEALIKEKEMEIAKLKAEIKELRLPTGIASLTKNHLCTVYRRDDGAYRPNSTRSDEWGAIKKLCMIASGAIYVKDLSEEQMYVAAEMADEIIEIFNKYYKAFHSLARI